MKENEITNRKAIKYWKFIIKNAYRSLKINKKEFREYHRRKDFLSEFLKKKVTLNNNIQTFLISAYQHTNLRDELVIN